MHLGIVMMGAGVQGAACMGVLREMARRQVIPDAVCGLRAGAWPAALHIAGLDAERMEYALAQSAWAGVRLLQPDTSARRLIAGGAPALCRGRRLQKLLIAQAGERILPMCERQGLFLCRLAHNGRRIAFATHNFEQEEGLTLILQVSVSFAARAAMGMPPFLAPLQWMGMPLLPETDAAAACRQLFCMGVQRVIIVAPEFSRRHMPDALELMTGENRVLESGLPEYTGILRVPLPDDVGALSLSRMMDCADAGEQAARQGLDGVFKQIGMSFCRVIPFRRSQCGR